MEPSGDMKPVHDCELIISLKELFCQTVISCMMYWAGGITKREINLDDVS